MAPSTIRKRAGKPLTIHPAQSALFETAAGCVTDVTAYFLQMAWNSASRAAIVLSLLLAWLCRFGLRLGAIEFNGGALHVTANMSVPATAIKFTTSYTGATGSSTGEFDIDAGVMVCQSDPARG